MFFPSSLGFGRHVLQILSLLAHTFLLNDCLIVANRSFGQQKGQPQGLPEKKEETRVGRVLARCRLAKGHGPCAKHMCACTRQGIAAHDEELVCARHKGKACREKMRAAVPVGDKDLPLGNAQGIKDKDAPMAVHRNIDVAFLVHAQGVWSRAGKAVGYGCPHWRGPCGCCKVYTVELAAGKFRHPQGVAVPCEANAIGLGKACQHRCYRFAVRGYVVHAACGIRGRPPEVREIEAAVAVKGQIVGKIALVGADYCLQGSVCCQGVDGTPVAV